MKIIRALLLACGLPFLSGGAALAQSYYEIEGVIYGPNFKPLANVVIVLQDQVRAQIAQAITSTDGQYRFSRVTAGVYYLVVRPDEAQFLPTTQRVELINTARVGTNNPVERVDLTLKPAPRRADSSTTPATVFAQAVPPAAEAEYTGAMESLVKGKKDQAVCQLHRALELFPSYFLAAQQLGLLQVEEEQFEQAVAPLQKALEVNPKAAPSRLALGIAYVNLNRSADAATELDQARKLDAKSFRVHLYLGMALLNLDRLEEAEKSLKEAYALGGSSKAAMARLYLASIYSKRQQYQQAVAELEAYLRDNPKAANAANIQQAIKKLKAKL